VEIAVSFAIIPYLLKIKSYNEIQLQISTSRRVLDTRSWKRSKWKISGIGHGSREAGRQTSSRRVEIKCALRVI
jgi:hypothetical protein